MFPPFLIIWTSKNTELPSLSAFFYRPLALHTIYPHFDIMHKDIILNLAGLSFSWALRFCVNGPLPKGYTYFRKPASFGVLHRLIFYLRNTVTPFGDHS